MASLTTWVLFEDSCPTASLASEREPLALVAGPSYLTLPPGRPPEVRDLVPPPSQACWFLEPVTVAGQPRLLVLSPPGRPVRINGQPAPPAALAALKDELQFDDGPVFFVSLRHDRHVGPPPADAIGRECPICRGRLTADTVVYTCPGCGARMHLEPEDRGPDRLECALVGRECLCQTAIVLEQGYAWTPEF